MIIRPSHRNPDLMVQTEVCSLCGSLVEHTRLVDADVEGLRGFVVCDVHPFEAKARFAMSYRDYQRLDPGVDAPDAGARLEPIGEEFWFVDPENA